MAFEISPNYRGSVELSPSVILLVDDDPDIRSLTRTFLEHEGYSVFSSGDAERAAQIFRSVPQIDLLVTDVYMPGRSGLELARELKAIRSELPVLLISGGVLEEGQRRGCGGRGGFFWLNRAGGGVAGCGASDSGGGGGAEVAGGETGGGCGGLWRGVFEMVAGGDGSGRSLWVDG